LKKFKNFFRDGFALVEPFNFIRKFGKSKGSGRISVRFAKKEVVEWEKAL